MKATQLRTYREKQTTSIFHMFDGDDLVFKMFTLEPPWKDNEPFVSCIPEDTYIVEKVVSPKYGECFEIKDVEGRTHILYHNGNKLDDTLGCNLTGDALTDIDNDGLVDVVNSKETRKKFEAITDKFELTIKS